MLNLNHNRDQNQNLNHNRDQNLNFNFNHNRDRNQNLLLSPPCVCWLQPSEMKARGGSADHQA